MKVKKPDGTVFDVQLKHTMNENQIQWFRHGSALNYMKAQQTK